MKAKRGIGIHPFFKLTGSMIFFRKMHLFKTAVLLYQSSLERKNFVKLKERQLFHSVIKLINEALSCSKCLYEMKN